METKPLVLLGQAAMARRLRVPARWLREEARAGRLPHVRAGSQFLFNADAVETVLAARAARVPEEEQDSSSSLPEQEAKGAS